MTSTTGATASTDAILVTAETLRCSRTIERRSNAGSVTWREYEQKSGNALDEDVKIGVILALAQPSVQNHCHSNPHILKSNTQVSTVLFDYCRAEADVAAIRARAGGPANSRQRQTEGQRRQARPKAVTARMTRKKRAKMAKAKTTPTRPSTS